MTAGPNSRPSLVNWRTACIALAAAGIAVFFMLPEHQRHILGLLPFLLLAACPLLHLFMHRGHSGHGANP